MSRKPASRANANASPATSLPDLTVLRDFLIREMGPQAYDCELLRQQHPHRLDRAARIAKEPTFVNSVIKSPLH